VFPNNSAGHFATAFTDYKFNDNLIAGGQFERLSFKECSTQRNVLEYTLGVLAPIALPVFDLHLQRKAGGWHFVLFCVHDGDLRQIYCRKDRLICEKVEGFE